jgi:CTP synthase
VIALITEWQTEDGRRETRDAEADKGGSMRLGGQNCRLEPGSLARRDLRPPPDPRAPPASLRVQQPLLRCDEGRGLRFSGWSLDSKLVEIVEIPDHPWFVGCQFHPEFTSTPRDGHPLFRGFINAALALAPPECAAQEPRKGCDRSA